MPAGVGPVGVAPVNELSPPSGQRWLVRRKFRSSHLGFFTPGEFSHSHFPWVVARTHPCGYYLPVAMVHQSLHHNASRTVESRWRFWTPFGLVLVLELAACFVEAATAEVKPDSITISNGLVSRTFSIKDGVCQTVRFTNLLSKTPLEVTDQGPHLRLLNGQEVPSTALKVAGNVAVAPPNAQGPQVSVTVPVACTQPVNVKAQLHLQATDGQHFIHKWYEVDSSEAVDAIQVEQLAGQFKPELGGRGQPVFVDGCWFAGLEYPAGYAEGAQGQLRMYHFPGQKTFTTKRAVWGIDSEGNLVDSFEAYLDHIRIKPRSFFQYNSWWDLRDTELAVETLAQRFEEFRKAMLVPYGLRFDAFVADDGWQDDQSIWDVNRKILPQGYKPLADALAKGDSRVGLWMPLNGANLDIGWGVKQGYEKSDHGDYYCLAGERYGSTLRKVTEVRIRDANLIYYKHDFNWFRCSGKGHRHHPTPRHGFEANVDAFLDLLAWERKLQPDIFINLSSGAWLSPWWLMHADTVWAGGGEFGYDKNLPQLSPREWEMSFRDQHLYDRFRSERQVCPLSALGTSGIIHGRRNRLGGPNETLSQWSDAVVWYYGRGVMLKELYLTPSLLNAEWWDVLGRATRWAIANTETLVHTRMIGAEPRSGGVYGYVHWSPNKGVMVLRNPSPAAQPFELTFNERPRRFGPPTVEWAVEVVYPHHELLPMQLSAAKPVKLDLPGCSVLVVEVAPLSVPDPRPRGVRFLDGGRTCRAQDAPSAVAVAAGTGGPGPQRPQLTLNFTLPPQPLPRADVLIISRGANVLPLDAPTANDKPAAVEKAEGVGWQMLRIDCAAMTGPIKIVAPIAQQSVPFVFSPPTLEAWLLTEIPLPIATPASQPTSAATTAASQPTTAPSTQTTTTTTATAQTRPSTSPVTTAASGPTTTRAAATGPVASAPVLQPALPPDRPLPRPYRPEVLRQSHCLLPPTSPGAPWVASATLKPEELATIKAAKLHVELYDVDGGAYANKFILFNGQQLCQIPPSKGPISVWEEHLIDLPAEMLKTVKMANEVQFNNTPKDLFKFRGVALAVQLADGRWVTSSLAGQTYSSSHNWSYAEGEIFEGEVSPKITVSFQPPK